jgi:hypothetical protein
MMLHHIAAFNAVFASIQLLIAAGLFYRRTAKPALAASIVWALFVWCFGESLGGILTGSTPLAGVPGAVLLYALIAALLLPTARPPSGRVTSPATESPAGATAAGSPGSCCGQVSPATCSCPPTGRLTRFRLSFRAPMDSQDGSQPS